MRNRVDRGSFLCNGLSNTRESFTENFMWFQENVELLWATEKGKSNPISLILPSPMLLKLLASTCSLCVPGQEWNTVASLSADLLAQCRTECSVLSLPYRSVSQQLALSPLRLEWCQIPLLCHMSLHGWNRKSRADTWTKPKREKTSLVVSEWWLQIRVNQDGDFHM